MKLSSSVLAVVLSMARALPDRIDRASQLPASISDLKLDTPLEMSEAPQDVVDQLVVGATTKPARAEVIISLSADSVASSKAQGKDTAPGQVKKVAQAQQEFFLETVLAVDPQAKVLAEVQVLLNAIIVNVDSSVLEELGASPDVVRVAPVGNYELDLSETVPYIGAKAVQDTGFDGSGIKVAVLDSGIDYMHANFGGPGTIDAYDEAYGDPASRDGLFPTAKVVEGKDFVGEEWSATGDPLAPDNDPIGIWGHGTHVADIIAGVNGVAPGAELLAVKVCSAVSTQCSGVAMIQGMEYAVDPNGDGDPSDHVDIVNLSIGSVYGQPFDDDLSAAVNAASGFGVLTVSTAGNDSDKPYVTGTPGSAETALSVAETQMPSATLQTLKGNNVDDILAVFQPWSVPIPPGTSIVAPVQYGDGDGNNLLGCDPFDEGSLTGKIVLLDRGDCTYSLKISHISQAGGSAGIIGLVAPGAPFSATDGGDRPIDIPGYMITQADADASKDNIPFVMTIDPSNSISLVKSMAGTSSRGPQHEAGQLIKPEIGAPGASVSAVAGTGDQEKSFGGTSGAAPMVSGAAALLLQANAALTPLEVKALLMNNGETDIDSDPFSGLAPITRIGGGEVRVNKALAAPAAAWDDEVFQGALSFGFHDVAKATLVLQKTVRVRNYSDQKIVYRLSSTFRFANDEENGAVSIETPKKVTVMPKKDATFQVKMTIYGAALRGNYMNSGSEGANPDGLTLNEYDGYLILGDGNHPIHLAWHVLPRKAARVVGRSVLNFKDGADAIELTNNGVGIAQLDTFALLATSKNIPEGERGQENPTPDIRAVGINTIPVPSGSCSAEPSFVWAFAINTWERQQHLLPVSHEVWLDIDQDGNDDFVVSNKDYTYFGKGDGRQVVSVCRIRDGRCNIRSFAEHSMNTGNTVLRICGEHIGLTGTDIRTTNVDMYVRTVDELYEGRGDLVENLTVTPGGEQYSAIPADIEPGNSTTITVTDFGAFPGNSAEKGLLIFTNGDRDGPGARGGATQETEALILTNDPPKDDAGSFKSCDAISSKKQCMKDGVCEWDMETSTCVDTTGLVFAVDGSKFHDTVKMHESGCIVAKVSQWACLSMAMVWFYC